MEPNYVLDEMATAKKIINGDMPDAAYGNDSIIAITENVARIYLNLLSKVVLGNVPETASEEIVKARIELFDKVAEAVNVYSFGRLHKLCGVLQDAVEQYNVSTMWPNAKMKNNVATFIVDFWMWDETGRQDLLVIVDRDSLIPEAAPEDQPATTVEE